METTRDSKARLQARGERSGRRLFSFRGLTRALGHKRPIASASVSLLALAAPGQSFGQTADLTVSQAVWAQRVVNRQYQVVVAPGSPPRALYFWTRLEGGADALETLRRDGKLPIIHHWSHSTVFDQESEEVEVAQEKFLEVGQITDAGGVSASVRQSGTFRWRTWSHKLSLVPGNWTVTVRYATGEPVLCAGSPCRFSIELR